MSNIIQSIFAGLGGMFAWGTSDFFAGLFSKKIGHFKTFFWSQAAALCFSVSLLFFFAINLDISFPTAVLLMVAAVFYACAYLFFYKGLEIGNISVISATLNLWAVFTMFFAFVFLGQRLCGSQLLGVLMIVLGVFLVSVRQNGIEGKSIKLLSGVKETVAAAFLFGIFWNLSEIISEKIGWLATTIFIKAGIIIFLILVSFFLKRNLSLAKTSAKTKLMVAVVGILEAVAVASVNWGLTVGDVILVTPISSALSIVTIGMAIVFLRERITKTQAFGMAIAVGGIILTAL